MLAWIEEWGIMNMPQTERPVKTCDCSNQHAERRVVLTGGPGAGKTAVLELIRISLCKHVKVLPEAAGIVFGGGFPREPHPVAQRAAQRAIFHVQRELEAAAEAWNAALVLCDRGTIDGIAYWPGPPDFWPAVGTTLEQELERYSAVIHLRTPRAADYNRSNPLRIESALQAEVIDQAIEHAWSTHPNRFIVESTADFLTKATRALEILSAQLPECCRGHTDAALQRVNSG
jgi:predicted ATPase